MTTLIDAGFSDQWSSLLTVMSAARSPKEKQDKARVALKTLAKMEQNGKLTRFQHLSAAVDVIAFVPVEARKPIITQVYTESCKCGSHAPLTDLELLQVLTRLSDASIDVQGAPTGPIKTALLLAAAAYEAGDFTSVQWKKTTEAILYNCNPKSDATLLDVLSAIDRQLPDRAMSVKETLEFKRGVLYHIEDSDLRSSRTVLLHTEMQAALAKGDLSLDVYLTAAQDHLPYGCTASAVQEIAAGAQRVTVQAYKDGNLSLMQSLQAQNNLTRHLKDCADFNRVTVDVLDSELAEEKITLGAYLKGMNIAFSGLCEDVRAEIAPKFMERTGQYILSGSPEGTEVYLKDDYIMSEASRNSAAFAAQIAAYPHRLRDRAVDKAWSYINQAQQAGLMNDDDVMACQRSLLWQRAGDQSSTMHRPNPVSLPVLLMFNEAAQVIAQAASDQKLPPCTALSRLNSLLSYDRFDDEKFYTEMIQISGYSALVEAAVPVMAGLANEASVRESFEFMVRHDMSPEALAQQGIFVYERNVNWINLNWAGAFPRKERLCALFGKVCDLNNEPLVVMKGEVAPLSVMQRHQLTDDERSALKFVMAQAQNNTL